MSFQNEENNCKVFQNDKLKLNFFKEKLRVEEISYRKLSDKMSRIKPFKRPLKENALTEKNFNHQHQKANKIKPSLNSNFILKTNYITTDRHSSLTDIQLLKRITLKDMWVNRVHVGFYLECRIIADPYYLSGMHLLIKDLNGDVEVLVLYNYETKSVHQDPKFLLPIGTQLIIKEPHLQLLSIEENETDFRIRVDSPTDVIVQSYSDCDSAGNKSADELIDDGNNYFSKSYYHAAIRFYSKALEKSSYKSSRAFLNRSQSYLKLDKPYSAYQDAQQAVKLDKNNEKAYFRLGKSAYLLGKFQDAFEHFTTCMKLNVRNLEVECELKKVNERLNESRTGIYNFQALYEQFFKRDQLYMDVAEYKSDKIIVTDIPNKYKGVVAIDLITKGFFLKIF